MGALMPWAGKLYVANYVSHRKDTGTGTGLRVIERDFTMTRHPEGTDGTYANRMLHSESNQIIIGPHVIDAHHHVRTVPELVEVRLAGAARHLTDPANLIYVLGMEGELFELNMRTLACSMMTSIVKELALEGERQVHFKDCFTTWGRLIVCNNDYHEPDFLGKREQGRLAEYDGKAWRVIERKPYVAVHGRPRASGAVFATGWDQASAILSVLPHPGEWRRYRLPKASHCYDHKWQTEWPRIRETEHDRLLMDHHGMFYELSPWVYDQRMMGIRPISTHLWVTPDFCSWQGMLVMGADNASPHSGDRNVLTAEPQSGLWFGKTDDLWQFGKPKGWGGPWWKHAVKAGESSDPYLMNGFEHKCVHISQDQPNDVRFTVEVDFMGCDEWSPYTVLTAPSAKHGGYVQHTFPTGFSAHWVRLRSDRDCVATAQFHYT
ncbi:MAG: hypothetical protein WD042_05500 [Phycisphaeraceae bacterium]